MGKFLIAKNGGKKKLVLAKNGKFTSIAKVTPGPTINKITWNGNTTGKVHTAAATYTGYQGGTFYKVSDLIPTASQIQSFYYTELVPTQLSQGEGYIAPEDAVNVVYIQNAPITLLPPFSSDEVTIQKNGLYFLFQTQKVYGRESEDQPWEEDMNADVYVSELRDSDGNTKASFDGNLEQVADKYMATTIMEDTTEKYVVENTYVRINTEFVPQTGVTYMLGQTCLDNLESYVDDYTDYITCCANKGAQCEVVIVKSVDSVTGIRTISDTLVDKEVSHSWPPKPDTPIPMDFPSTGVYFKYAPGDGEEHTTIFTSILNYTE